MVNYSLAQKRVGCYGDNLPPKVMNVEYLNAYLFNYSCLNLSDVPPHEVEDLTSTVRCNYIGRCLGTCYLYSTVLFLPFWLP